MEYSESIINFKEVEGGVKIRGLLIPPNKTIERVEIPFMSLSTYPHPRETYTNPKLIFVFESLAGNNNYDFIMRWVHLSTDRITNEQYCLRYKKDIEVESYYNKPKDIIMVTILKGAQISGCKIDCNPLFGELYHKINKFTTRKVLLEKKENEKLYFKIELTLTIDFFDFFEKSKIEDKVNLKLFSL